jgi:hypothetical protein
MKDRHFCSLTFPRILMAFWPSALLCSLHFTETFGKTKHKEIIRGVNEWQGRIVSKEKPVTPKDKEERLRKTVAVIDAVSAMRLSYRSRREGPKFCWTLPSLRDHFPASCFTYWMSVSSSHLNHYCPWQEIKINSRFCFSFLIQIPDQRQIRRLVYQFTL